MTQANISQNLESGISGQPSGLERGFRSFVPTVESLSVGIPSKPLFNLLPIRRVIPQDAHSVLDYGNGVTCFVSSFFCEKDSARWCSLVLGGSVIGVSLLTDYKLSLSKLIPIEAHEVIDHVWGLSCIAAPFVFGYYKKDPFVALTHVLLGVTTILGSLFTDYRAVKGRGRMLGRSSDLHQPSLGYGDQGLGGQPSYAER